MRPPREGTLTDRRPGEIMDGLDTGRGLTAVDFWHNISKERMVVRTDNFTDRRPVGKATTGIWIAAAK